MKEQIKLLWKVCGQLTEPSNLQVEDETIRPIIGYQNKMLLLFLLVCQLIYFPLMLISNTNLSTIHLLNISLSIGIVLGIILLSKNYTKQLHFSYFIISCIYGPLVAWLSDEGLGWSLVTIYISPTLINLVTMNSNYHILASLFQIGVLNFFYKGRLVEALYRTQIERYADNFIKLSSFSTLVIVILILIITNNLQRSQAMISETTVMQKEYERQKQFLMSFSHELRNPINSLMGNLQLALMENASLKVKELLDTAKLCGELLLHLVNNILDRGKLELGGLEINMVNLNLYESLDRIWTICSETIKRKNLQGYLKVSKSIPEFMKMDHHRLMQILLNLVSNSVKFTESGTIMVSIYWLQDRTEVTEDCFYPFPYDDENEGVFEKDEATAGLLRKSGFHILSLEKKHLKRPHKVRLARTNNGILKIVVKDTGCGIQEQQLNSIFKVTTQSENQHRNLGSGLGLSITGQICQKMNGTIRAFSKEKRGSTFIICIPTISVNKSNNVINTGRDSLETIHTMVVDDAGFNLQLHSEFLQRLGVKSTERAENGRKAYELFVKSIEDHKPIKIILMDLDMPVMDGKEASKEIRRYERVRGLRPCIIIVISGNWNESDIQECLDPDGQIKANYFLKKPIVLEDLKNILLVE